MRRAIPGFIACPILKNAFSSCWLRFYLYTQSDRCGCNAVLHLSGTPPQEGHMRNLLPVLVLITTALVAGRGPAAAEVRSAGHLLTPSSASVPGHGNAFVPVGGMGGGGGGMGMGGAGGGMGGGGMGGMMGGGMGTMGGGAPGYGAMPGGGAGRPYGGGDTTGGGAGAQPAQYYLCVTPYDRCSLASSPGSVRSGGACTCSNGHQGKIK